MKKCWLSLVCIFLFMPLLQAQNVSLGQDLGNELSSSEPEVLRVDVVLNEQVDLVALQNDFRENHTSVTDRAKTTLRELQKTAQNTQKPLLKRMKRFADRHPGALGSIESHWIINLLVVEAAPELVRWLSQQPEVSYIDLASARTVDPLELPEPMVVAAKQAGTREPGLDTVNAPGMWALGYTGRGRLCFNLDTGIWDDHPAFSDRFLAHHFPIVQAYFGYDAPYPLDKEGSHGTHTLGTSVGLVEDTQDTIGLAFNARWIASDPVATSAATVKPLSDFMYAFEWALNPDGDTATTSDIPDVINNSWGFFIPTDTNLCTSYVSQMFDALQAAGIANVFSAGNDGPNPGTVSEPQNISRGLVNTFTVGAVNHHNPGNPIAGFSSRGPTNCPATGSVQIKPEVVAPGVNVRSAAGHSGFANYQGTSMAGPHVTGAVLLLKEAFPLVSGEEILLALYFSARDLGTAGEDNDYGNGLIDVVAAYNYLAQTYTPAPPANSAYEVAITGFLNPVAHFSCDTSLLPSVILENLGDSTVSGGDLRYGFVGGNISTVNYSGTLVPGQKDTVLLPGNLRIPPTGQVEFLVRWMINTAQPEVDTVNNRRIMRFFQRSRVGLPFREDFESIHLDSSQWFVQRYDLKETWDTIATGGLAGSQFSATVQLGDYSPRARQIDELVSPAILLPDTGQLAFRFDLSYQFRNAQIFSDTLNLQVSLDCGASWQKIWEKGGSDLSTNDTIERFFVPGAPGHWREEGGDLASLVGAGSALFRFGTVNMGGNHVYVDNFEVYQGAAPVSIQEELAGEVAVLPNPAGDFAQVRWNLESAQAKSLRLLEMTGREIGKWDVRGAQSAQSLSLINLPSGIYLIGLETSEGVIWRRLVRQ